MKANKRPFSAKDARSIMPDPCRGVDRAIEAIQSAAKRGQERVTLSSRLVDGDADKICLELRKRGFKADYILDQKDGDYYDIKW